MSAVAPQHTGDSNAPAAETDIGGASAHAHNTINSRELSLEDQAGAGSSHVMSKEMVKIDQNHRDGIDGGENLHRSMNKGITQRRNRDTFDSENLPNQENASRETVKSEPVLEQLEGTHRQEQLGLSELEDGVHDEIIAQSPRGAGDNENTSDPSSAHVQPHDSPATSDRVQPRQTGRKRGRGEVESRYWTRSKKPHSSSKRSRRTNYWLRP